jgi:uncharacterized protein
MFKRILPKEYDFYKNFNELIAIVSEASDTFAKATDMQIDFAEAAQKIKKLEREADKIVHSSTEKLHNIFITPFDRNDIYTLLKKIDDILDQLNSVSGRIITYSIEQFRPEIHEFADIINKCVIELKEAIRLLEKLGKSEASIISKKCKAVHEYENEADDIHKKAIKSLFSEGDALNIIKWKEIYERLEKAVDRCEDLASLIEGIMIDNS